MADDRFLFRVCGIPEERAQFLLAKKRLDLSDLTPEERRFLECSVPFLKTPRFQALDSKEKTAVLSKAIVRAAFRSVPFAAYSGVALGKLGKQTDFRIATANWKLQFASEKKTEKTALNPTLSKSEFCLRLWGRQEKNTRRRLPRHPGVEQLISGSRKLTEIPKGGKDKLLSLEVLQPVSERLRYESLRSEKQAVDPTRLALLFSGIRPTLEEKKADQVRCAAEFVMETEFQRSRPPLCSFSIETRLDFVSKYGRNEVSLLELCENQPRLFANLAEKASTSNPKGSRFDAGFRELIMEKSLQNETDVRISSSDEERMFRDRHWKPSFLTAAGSLVSVDGTEMPFLRSIAGSSLLRHYARYCGFEEIRREAKILAETEENHFQDAVLAEVFISPNKEGYECVMPFLGFHRHVIPLTPLARTPCVSEIPLSDLTVSYWHDSFRLRSKKLNREVIPVITHLGNVLDDPNALFRFLAKVAFQAGPFWTTWRWDSIQRVHPRLTYKGVIISPRTFRTTTNEVRSLKKNTATARKFLRKIGVPSRFILLKNGIQLYFDQDSENSMRELLKRPDEGWILSEYLPPVGGRNHEFVLSIFPETPWKKRINNSLLHKGLSPEEKTGLDVFNPGSQWVYLKVFVKLTDMDGFLGKRLFPWIKKQRRSDRISSWFYVKFLPPEPHLRIRIKATDTDRLQKSLCEEIGKNPNLKFEIASYEPEWVRYGGKSALRVIEKIFETDSEYVIRALDKIRSVSKLDLSALCQIAVFRALQFHAQLFPPGMIAKEPIYKKNEKRRPKEQREVSDEVRRIFLTRELGLKPLLESVQSAIAPQEQREFGKLRALLSSGKCSVDAASLFHSLMHMNAFRIDAEFAQKNEPLILDIVFSILRVKTRA